MRIFWKLVKAIIGLAIAIPLLIVLAVTTLGVLGALLGLAIIAIKLACVGLAGYGLYRLARYFLAPTPVHTAAPALDAPARDPYYEAAMRELDTELKR